MKYKYLRYFMKYKRISENYTLENCKLVIDGKSYFHAIYKHSGCQFILGGECDRFAEYLRGILKQFINSNVTVYVIFGGAALTDIQDRLIRHQKKIDIANNIKPNEENEFCDVLAYVNNVIQEVLGELGIKYYTPLYNSREAVVTISKYFNCPVLTNNFELSLFGVDCIPPIPVSFDSELKCISCKIFYNTKCRYNIRVPDVPMFLTLADQDLPSFEPLLQVIGCKNEYKFINILLYWSHRRTKQEILTILKNILSREDFGLIMQELEFNEQTFKSKNKMVREYFQCSDFRLNDKSDWFERGIACGRIATEYINLMNYGIFSGSWLSADMSKDDAMLASMEIIVFAYALLVNSKKVKITFVGRKGYKSDVWEIEDSLDLNIPPKALFTLEIDLFKMFLDYSLPGFNLDTLRTLAPDDTWLLIIALVYYSKKVEKDIYFKLAGAVLLSYVMIGPVTDRIGVIKRGKLIGYNKEEDINCNSHYENLRFEDCVDAAKVLMPYFYSENIKDKYDVGILHYLAEFQHCLQQINNLKKLAGSLIPSTIYHKTYNGTFVFNILWHMKLSDDPVKDLVGLFQNNSTVGSLYESLVKCFEGCLQSVS